MPVFQARPDEVNTEVADRQQPRSRINVRWFLLAALAMIVLCGTVYNFRMLEASVVIARRPHLLRFYEETFGHQIGVSDLSIPGTNGPVDIRLYAPRGTRNPPPIVLVHGLINLGNRHEYLNELAAHLARMGFLVVLPNLPAETRFEMRASDLVTIDDTIRWAASRTKQSVTLVGNSFSAGLIIPAAASPSVGGEVKLIFCVSGYYSLDHIGHYFLHDPVYDPEGKPYVGNPPTLLKIAVPYLNELLPASDVPNVRKAVEAFNQNGDVTLPPDNPAMRRLNARQRQEFEELRTANTPEMRELYRRLFIEHGAEIAAISPSSVLKKLHIPIYILHGENDPVFPEGEVEWMRKDTAGRAEVHILVSPWLNHVTVGVPTTWWQKYRVVSFCEQMLRKARNREPLHN